MNNLKSPVCILLTHANVTDLAHACFDIHEAIAIDSFGSIEAAEDCTAKDMVECGLTADRIDQFCDYPGLSDVWRSCCEMDYQEAQQIITREVKRQWGY